MKNPGLFIWSLVWLVTTVVLFSLGHWIGGSVALVFVIFGLIAMDVEK